MTLDDETVLTIIRLFHIRVDFSTYNTNWTTKMADKCREDLFPQFYITICITEEKLVW